MYDTNLLLGVELVNAERDDFGGRLQTLSRHTGKAFELLALAVNAPRFDEEPFDRVREQIKAHLRHEINDPGTMAWRGFRARVFAGHGAAAPMDKASRVVSREDIDAIAAESRAARSAPHAAVQAVGGDASLLARRAAAACLGREQRLRTVVVSS